MAISDVKTPHCEQTYYTILCFRCDVPLVTLIFIQSHQICTHPVANTIHFNLNANTMPYVNSLQCYVNSNFSSPYFWSDFAMEHFWQKRDYLTYCRVSECPPSLKYVPQLVLIKIRLVILWLLFWMQTSLVSWTTRPKRLRGIITQPALTKVSGARRSPPARASAPPAAAASTGVPGLQGLQWSSHALVLPSSF